MFIRFIVVLTVLFSFYIQRSITSINISVFTQLSFFICISIVVMRRNRLMAWRQRNKLLVLLVQTDGIKQYQSKQGTDRLRKSILVVSNKWKNRVKNVVLFFSANIWYPYRHRCSKFLIFDHEMRSNSGSHNMF